MRLTHIKLAGFKSFVDPTTIPLIGNLAAVVGPNGCGKSNVIDAVRWVMGESSAKKLRGGEIADVIFNGSAARKPLGQASVELNFDNSDGRLGGEYANFSEISIRRVVTREGQSSYYLNGTKCRRRDITDVFMGTGLGPRSYAIIEQGTISRVIEAKPDEMRQFVEEPAGISKYKERRRETENRIKHTRENLDRLSDLREELEKQLNHLQRQANAAQKFRTLKAEERLLDAQLAAMIWSTLDNQISQYEAQIRDSATGYEQAQAFRRSIETELEKSKIEQQEAQEALNAVQEQFYQLGNEITRVEESIKHLEERKQTLQLDHQQTLENLDQTKSLVEKDKVLFDEMSEKVELLEPQVEELQAQLESSSMTLSDKEEAMEQWREQWDDIQRQSEQINRQTDVSKNTIDQLERQIHQSRTREQKLNEELERLNQSSQLADVQNIEMNIEEFSQKIEHSDEQITQLQSEKKQANESLQASKRDLKDAEKTQSKLEAKMTSMQALQEAFAQTDDKASAWLQDSQLEQNKRLFQAIDVDSQWSKACETVLGDSLQAVIIDSDELSAVAGMLTSMESGALQLLTKGATGSQAQAKSWPTLSSKVKALEPIAQLDTLLTGIYAIESLDEALVKLSELGETESIITLDGVWLSKQWVRVNRKEKDLQIGVLERESLIESLKEEIAQSESNLERLKEVISTQEDLLLSIDDRRENAQFERNQWFKQLTEERATLSTHQERQRHFDSRSSQINQELNEISTQNESWQQEIDEARSQVASAIEQMALLNDQRQEFEVTKANNQEELYNAKQAHEELKDQERHLALELNQAQAELNNVNQNKTRLEAQLEQFQSRLNQIEAQQAQSDDPSGETQQQLETLVEQRLNVEQMLNSSRDTVNELQVKVQTLDKERNEHESQASVYRETLEKAKLDRQGLTVRKETAHEKLQESEYAIEELLQNMPEEANERDWQMRLEQIGQQITRLGAINLAAIDEFESQKERKVYLDSQDEDLNEALRTLEGAIAKIDRETRQRFKDTFDKINENFQALYPKLFGGGQAYLTLTGDDLLDTGISVMARPPGKKNTTIHLLSGGEKALTAAALVFSIFQLNPAPFCMLDEVDAPLDDHNVGRLCNLVKEMSKTVQYIYISHNKLALEMADQLQGVTMKEPGVSRIVTVDVEEAASMAEA